MGTLSSLASPSQSISWGELSEASVVTLAFQAANLSPPERGEDSGPSRCLITPSPQAGGDPEDPGAVGEPWVSRPVRNGWWWWGLLGLLTALSPQAEGGWQPPERWCEQLFTSVVPVLLGGPEEEPGGRQLLDLVRKRVRC